MPAVIIDTNLLVLLVTGIASKSYIGRHKRLRAYDEADFDLLLDLIAPYSPIIVTPNTLTETSNLINQIGDPIRTHIAATFSEFLSRVDERYVESKLATTQAEFLRLGLTDCALLSGPIGPHLLLTADHDLFVAAIQRGNTAINFNHIRPQ